MKNSGFNKSLGLSYLSLFTSLGTIFCCALPALLVSIGLGATFASLVGVFPQIVWLSEHKVLVLSLSGVLIASSFILLYLNRNAPCPIDPDLAKACRFSRKWSIRILVLSSVFWFIGFAFGVIAPFVL